MGVKHNNSIVMPPDTGKRLERGFQHWDIGMCQTYRTTSRLVEYGMIALLRRASSSAIFTMLAYNMCRRGVIGNVKHHWLIELKDFGSPFLWSTSWEMTSVS